MEIYNNHVSGDSFINRLAPRVKLTCMLILLTIVVALNNWKGFLAVIIFVSCLILSSHISISVISKRLKPFSWFFIFTGIMHFFFTPGKSLPYFPVGYINLTYDGIVRGGVILTRLSLVIIITSIFTLTTSPVDIAKGIEDLLAPLKKIIPSIEAFTSMTVLTIQFIPLLMEKAEAEIKHHRAHWKSEKGGFVENAKKFSYMVDSYVESVLQETDETVMKINLS